MRGNSDGTLVVFFGDLEQFQDQETRQYELLAKIWAQMKHCECTLNLAAKMELQNTNRSPKVTVQLSTKQQSITFSVLPAFNALGEPSGCVQGGGEGGRCGSGRACQENKANERGGEQRGDGVNTTEITKKVKVLIVQLCPTLCDPMDCSLPGSSGHGILQARTLEWVAMPFSTGSSPARD